MNERKERTRPKKSIARLGSARDKNKFQANIVGFF